jgi:hypothetical protein
MFDGSLWFHLETVATELHVALCPTISLVISLKKQNMWVHIVQFLEVSSD